MPGGGNIVGWESYQKACDQHANAVDSFSPTPKKGSGTVVGR